MPNHHLINSAEATPDREPMSQHNNSVDTKPSPTVEELLKMLSSTSVSKKPPPVPPKPRSNMEVNMSLEAAKRTLGVNTTSKVALFSRKSALDGDSIDHSLKHSEPLDEKTCSIDSPLSNQLLLKKTIESKSMQPEFRSKPIGHVIYDSSLTKKSQRRDDGAEPHSRIETSRPIVTEYPEETNNNNNHTRRVPSSASTVEIREMPMGDNRYHQDSSDNDHVGNKYDDARFNCQDHKNVYATSVTTSTTDDEEGDLLGIKNKSTSAVPVETILNDSSDEQPPRSSTPTSIRCQFNATSSSSDTSTNNNRSNNRSSQNTYISHGLRDTSDDDTLNNSRETDDINNTGSHNQSGCELIGINDNSDSKDSPRTASEQKVPYFVQVFNDTTMSSTYSPQSKPTVHLNQSTFHEGSDYTELRKFVSDLQDEVRGLRQTVDDLNGKVETLEIQLEDQKRVASSKVLSTSQVDGIGKSSPSASGSYKRHFSQSTSTLNKLRHQNSPKVNGGHSSTYLRGKGPMNSRNENNPSQPDNHNSHSAHYDDTLGRSSASASHARSTGSLLSDSLKVNVNSSISPTFSQQASISPLAYSNLSQSRHEPSSYSMMSLNSIDQSSAASTLKRGSAAGSISNLSQIGSQQLTNWPSMSNFITSKQQAKDILLDEDERVIRMALYNNVITMRIPSWIEDDYYVDRVIESPSIKLKLDWVHGYRGKDCRSNIYYLPTGECVYFVASIVVLYNPEQKTQRHYLGHTDSVKCLAIHPNRLIVATGQSAILNRRDKRPIVRVWNSVSLATLRVIGFNEDFDRSICCLAFSKHDQGAILAVVDESSEHTITLLDWQREKNWRVAEANSGHEPVLAIDFHPIDKYSLVAVGKSSVNFWDVRGLTLAKKAGLFDKFDRPKYVLCMTFNDIGDTITGDSNGNIIIWPRGANRPRTVIRDAHPGGVFSVLAMKDGTYLTGGRDRKILEWDEQFQRTGRKAEIPEHCGGVRFITYAKGSQVFVGTLRNTILIGSLENDFKPIVQGHTEATSALAVHPTQSKYLTGGFDEQVHLIDARTHQIEWSKCLGQPATAASFSNDGSLLIVGSLSGNWLVLDVYTRDVLFSACDGTGTIQCVKFSPKGDYFCLGSSDTHAYMYQLDESGSRFLRVGACVGHSGPVREIDWSDDNNYIQTQSMNFELLFWKANNCRLVDDQEIVYDLKWTTHNCTIGFHAIGIWSDSIDSAIINYCDRSNSEQLMVSVTDTGYINVQRWPTCYNQCLSQKFNGNCDKLNFVKFLSDDSKLIAVGAKSCVVTEWTIAPSSDT